MGSEFVTLERDATGEIVFIDHYLTDIDACEAAIGTAIAYANGTPNPRAAVEIEVEQVFFGDEAHLSPAPLVAYSIEQGAAVSSPRSRFAR